MTIGQRIKARREELNMSQDELAKRIGYKSRSSINKIELDLYELRQTKIKSIADALDTTPSYIMGWDEKNSLNDISEKTPTPASEDGRLNEFIALFAQLTEEQQKMIVAQIKGILAER